MTVELDTAQLHARLATVVGAEYVSAVPAEAHYGGLLGPALDTNARPRALVRPASAEQLQRLAPMIAELGHGLWSSPNGCGNGARAGHPRKPGVLVDLGRMNRIIDVDRRGAYAVLEAGVSYAELAAHLHKRDLPLWLDADANGAHSVAGSVAARQWGLTPYGDHQAAQCGLEAVLANGSIVRTGMGALPGSDCWPRYKYNYGPALDGLFSRAHFGIVTKLGLWLMPAPRRFLPFMAGVADLKTLAALVERLRPLLLDGTLSGRLIIASQLDDEALLARAASTAKGGSTPPWTLYGALYGLPDAVDIHWQTLRQAFAGLGGAELVSESTTAAWPLRVRQLRGESLYEDAQGGDGEALWFGLLAPPSGDDAVKLHHGVLTRLADYAPRLAFHLAPRLLAIEVEVVVPAVRRAACGSAALAAIKDLVGHGYGLRHCAPELDATASARHTLPGLRHLNDGLGAALDPYGTFAARGQFKPAKR